MKTLIFIGIFFVAIGLYLAYAGSDPLTSLSKSGNIAANGAIVIGIILILTALIINATKKA